MVVNSHPPSAWDRESSTAIRTLLVDDSPAMLKLIALILKRAGNVDLVGSATNGSQALRYVAALSPDLVLMDVHMPRLNGIEAAQYIKQRQQPPVVILITSDDDPLTRSKAEQAGADGFIVKGENLGHSLIAALADIFGSVRTPVPSHA
jgi:CheY-like chemotaxis protein